MQLGLGRRRRIGRGPLLLVFGLILILSGQGAAAEPSVPAPASAVTEGAEGPERLAQSSTTTSPTGGGALNRSERMRLVTVFVLLLALAAVYSHLNDLPERRPRSLVRFGHHEEPTDE